MEKKELNFKMIKSGSIKYYLNLKQTKTNSKYISVTCSEVKDGNNVYKSFIFFEEQFGEFQESLENLIKAAENNEFKSKLIKVGNKKLYLNIKASSKGNPYMTMNCVSVDSEGKSKYETIFLFKDQFEDFQNAYTALISEKMAA